MLQLPSPFRTAARRALLSLGLALAGLAHAQPTPPLPALKVALTAVPKQTAATLGVFTFSVGLMGCSRIEMAMFCGRLLHPVVLLRTVSEVV